MQWEVIFTATPRAANTAYALSLRQQFNLHPHSLILLLLIYQIYWCNWKSTVWQRQWCFSKLRHRNNYDIWNSGPFSDTPALSQQPLPPFSEREKDQSIAADMTEFSPQWVQSSKTLLQAHKAYSRQRRYPNCKTDLEFARRFLGSVMIEGANSQSKQKCKWPRLVLRANIERIWAIPFYPTLSPFCDKCSWNMQWTMTWFCLQTGYYHTHYCQQLSTASVHAVKWPVVQLQYIRQHIQLILHHRLPSVLYAHVCNIRNCF